MRKSFTCVRICYVYSRIWSSMGPVRSSKVLQPKLQRTRLRVVWREFCFHYSFCLFPGKNLDLLVLLLEIIQEIVIRFPIIHSSDSKSDLSEGLHLPINSSATVYLHSFRTLQGHLGFEHFFLLPLLLFVLQLLLLAFQFETNPPNCGRWRKLTEKKPN